MKRHSGELCRGDASFFVSSTTTEPRAPHPLLPTPRKVDVGVLISSVDRVDGEETASRRVVEANTHESNATERFAGALLSAEPAVAGGVGAGKQVSVFVVDVVWAPMSPWITPFAGLSPRRFGKLLTTLRRDGADVVHPRPAVKPAAGGPGVTGHGLPAHSSDLGHRPYRGRHPSPHLPGKWSPNRRIAGRRTHR